MPFWDFFKKEKKQPEQKAPFGKQLDSLVGVEAPKSLKESLTKLQMVFKRDSDFTTRPLQVFGRFRAEIVYLNSLVDKEIINTSIIKSLITIPNHIHADEVYEKGMLKKVLFEEAIYHSEGHEEKDLGKIVESLLRGQTIVLIDGMKEKIVLDTFKIAHRSVTQPETEQVIRGPRDGFIEDLNTNISLVRYRLPTADLRVTPMEIGKITRSKVSILYIEGIVNPSLVQEVTNRLETINIDRILDAGYIEQLIQDNPGSPFPQINYTERPDVTVGNLLEGRVVVMVSGSPFSLIMPATFFQFLQTAEDYNERFIMASLVRLLRFSALFLSLVVPSIYVSIISYHPELIPARFAVAVTSGRTGVPFPLAIEVLIMEIAMEILREATVRMPKQIGGALSIVGVLVIGQAAVEAGFASPLTVVIIATTTIGSFATPAYNAAIALRMLRFPLLILSGMFGLYGTMIGWIVISNHVLSLQSFGVPYLSPISPIKWKDLRDTLVRAPLRWLVDRPVSLKTKDQRRIGEKSDEK